MQTDLERLEKGTVRQPNGCLVRTTSIMVTGYSGFWYQSKTTYAHRASWSMANNSPIAPGEVVMHSCDNPPCVEPTHLNIGTQSDNMRDRYAKAERKALS